MPHANMTGLSPAFHAEPHLQVATGIGGDDSGGTGFQYYFYFII